MNAPGVSATGIWAPAAAWRQPMKSASSPLWHTSTSRLSSLAVALHLVASSS